MEIRSQSGQYIQNQLQLLTRTQGATRPQKRHVESYKPTRNPLKGLHQFLRWCLGFLENQVPMPRQGPRTLGQPCQENSRREASTRLNQTIENESEHAKISKGVLSSKVSRKSAPQQSCQIQTGTYQLDASRFTAPRYCVSAEAPMPILNRDSLRNTQQTSRWEERADLFDVKKEAFSVSDIVLAEYCMGD